MRIFARNNVDDMLKLIKAIELQHWADTKESEVLMPELMRRLIHASIKDITRMSFPNEDCVNLPGFDGILETTFNNPYVPVGKSAFEIGTDKKQKGKADHDYNNRTREISDEEKANTHFVFVIARKWTIARKWENARNNERKWKSVRVLTAVELEDWLSVCPTVAVWLAAKMGKINETAKLKSLDDYWNKWSTNSKGMVLDKGILLGGREDECKRLIDYIKTPSEMFVQSSSCDESLAFVVAAIMNSCDQGLIERSVVVLDESTVQAMVEQYKNIVIITNSTNRDLGYAIQQNRNSIVYVSRPLEIPPYGINIELSAHDYHKFKQALEKSGYSDDEARTIARSCGRSVAILRHQLNFDTSTPEWVKRDDIQKIIPLLLVERWNEACKEEQRLISELCDANYGEVSMMVQRWLFIDSSPLCCKDNCRYVISPYDTFLYIRSYITEDIFARFAKVIKETLFDLDTNAMNHLNPEMPIYTLGKRKFTGLIREGLCHSLILMAILCDDRQEQVDEIVRGILKDTDMQWWLTYTHEDVIPLIAEASPDAFLQYIENDLKKEDSLMMRLFVPIKKKGFFGMEWEVNYSNVLFALEMIAWMPEYMMRVCCILAQLSPVINDSNYENKPINSLMEIFRVWYPMTTVETSERCKALRTLYRHYPDVMIDLCFKIAENWRHQYGNLPTRVSRWRLKEINLNNSITYGEIFQELQTVCDIIVNHGALSPEQTIKLLSMALDNKLTKKLRGELRNYLVMRQDILKSQNFFYQELKGKINRFRSIPNARWQIPNEELVEFEYLLESVTPDNLLDRLKYLFDGNIYEMPEIRTIKDYDLRIKAIQELRKDAAAQILSSFDIDEVFKYAEGLEHPEYLMQGLGSCETAIDIFDDVYRYARVNDGRPTYIQTFFNSYAFADRESFLQCVKVWHDDSFAWYPISGISPDDDLWGVVDSFNDQQQLEYWRHAYAGNLPPERIEYLLDNYQKAGNVDQMISIINHIIHHEGHYQLSHNLVVNRMHFAMSRMNCEVLHSRDYEIDHILKWIEKHPDTTDADIMKLELPYIIVSDEGIKEWRAYHIIVNSPQYMFELLDNAFYSENADIKEKEIQFRNEHPEQARMSEFCGRFLLNISTTPCTEEDGSIDVERLKGYITQFQEKAKGKGKLAMANHLIGQLLGNNPGCIQGEPPVAICEIIEELNNAEVNNSFHSKIYNRLGSTVRGPFDGGVIEWNRFERFTKTVKRLRTEYFVIASIYEDLAKMYSKEAKHQDVESEIIMLDN